MNSVLDALAQREAERDQAAAEEQAEHKRVYGETVVAVATGEVEEPSAEQTAQLEAAMAALGLTATDITTDTARFKRLWLHDQRYGPLARENAAVALASAKARIEPTIAELETKLKAAKDELARYISDYQTTFRGDDHQARDHYTVRLELAKRGVVHEIVPASTVDDHEDGQPDERDPRFTRREMREGKVLLAEREEREAAEAEARKAERAEQREAAALRQRDWDERIDRRGERATGHDPFEEDGGDE